MFLANLLLATNGDTIGFGEALKSPLIIVAMICGAFGIACVMLAKRVAIAVTKNPDVKPDDKTYVGMRIAGLVLIMIGFVLLFVWGALGLYQ